VRLKSRYRPPPFDYIKSASYCAEEVIDTAGTLATDERHRQGHRNPGAAPSSGRPVGHTGPVLADYQLRGEIDNDYGYERMSGQISRLIHAQVV
jgi:hypothetical protein